MSLYDSENPGLGESRPSPSARRRGGGKKIKLPKLKKGPQDRVVDKTTESDQDLPKRKRQGNKPRRGGQAGYRGPTPKR